jgi:methylated-DNA-[protein]-cysteine S-methyltransferase
MSAAHHVIESPLGDLTLVAEDGALTGRYFSDHRRRPDPRTLGRRTDPGFAAAVEPAALHGRLF